MQAKKPPGGGFFDVALLESQRLQRDAQALCFVSQCDHVAAGLAQNVFGHAHTVTGTTLVGVHSEAVVADAMDFGVEVADAHFFGLAGCECFARLESTENAEGLGFRIDKFHSITFLSSKSAVYHSVFV